MLRMKVAVLLLMIFMVTLSYNTITRMNLYKDFILSNFEKVPFDKLLNGPYVMPHDHPFLMQYIRRSVSPPSYKAYNLTHPNTIDYSQAKQTRFIINILGEKRGGFFVECGAYDGEHISNSLLFEKKYGWNGLLIEANPSLYADLMKKQRKSWSINACLSPKPYPIKVLFEKNLGLGKILNKSPETTRKERYIDMQCLPLYSILMAINTTTIDFFSLDIEGMELDVLMTIPWEKVDIRTLLVEVNQRPQGIPALLQYMTSVGYKLYGVSNFQNVPQDYIFHRDNVIPIKKSKYKEKA